MPDKDYMIVRNCPREKAEPVLRRFAMSQGMKPARDAVTGEPYYRESVSGKGLSHAYDEYDNLHLWWFFGTPSAPIPSGKLGGFASAQAAKYKAAVTALAKELGTGAYGGEDFIPTSQPIFPEMNRQPQWQQPYQPTPVAANPATPHPQYAVPRIKMPRVPAAELDPFAMGAVVMACAALLLCLTVSFTAGTVFAVLACVMSANGFGSTKRGLPIIAITVAVAAFAVALLRMLGVF